MTHPPSDVTGSFRLEVLTAHRDRTRFSCIAVPLDANVMGQATQDLRRHASACFVAVDDGTGNVAGYYTLAAGGVPLTDLPPALTKRLPRSPFVPVARVGRLAVDKALKGHKLGATLLADAAMRALRSEVAVLALVVDAKDEVVVAFYRHHRFEPQGTQPRQLIVPLGSFSRGG